MAATAAAANTSSSSSSNDSLIAEATASGRNWAYLALYAIPAFTVWGNVLVCVSVFVESRLRSRFNSFLVSLAISDLLCAVLVMPVSAFKMINGGVTHIPRSVCLVWYSLDVFFTASTLIHLCTISLDRYFALNNPLKYHRQKRKSALVMKIVLAWLIPFSIAGPLFIFALWLDKTREDSFKGCGPHNAYFIITATVVTFFLPLAIMTATYVLTVSTIVEQTKNAKDLNASLLPLVVRPSAQAFGLKAKRQNFLFGAVRNSASCNSAASNSCSADKSCVSPSRRRLLSPLSTPAKSTLSTAGSSAATLELPSPKRRNFSNVEAAAAAGTAAAAESCNDLDIGASSPLQGRRASKVEQVADGAQAIASGIDSNEVSRLLRVPSRVSVCSVYSDDGMLPSSDRRADSVSSCGTARKKLSFTIVTENAKKTFKPTTSEQKKRMDYIHRGSKAVQVLGILFGLFVVCYLPFFIAYLIDYFCVYCQAYTQTIVPILEWVGYSGSMFNPIVYHFFNPTFRKTFHRLMRCRCQRYGPRKRPNYVFSYKIGRPTA